MLVLALASALIVAVVCNAPDCGIRNQFRDYCFAFDYCTKWTCGVEKCGRFRRDSELLKIREARIIPQCAVTNSTSLKWVSAINSNIQVLTSGAFAYLPNLEGILLPYNLIRELHQGIFYNVNLPVLDLSYNKIVYISEGAFNGITGLKYLNLSNNELATLPVENLPRSLAYLNISYNFLERIALNGAKSPDLTSVDLSHNSLKNVALSFDNPLQGLDLTNNMLSDIDFYDINDCENLKIPANLFSKVPQFLEYSRIRRVALHPNPWHCDELRKLWSHLQNNNIEEVTPDHPESSPLCSNTGPLLTKSNGVGLECENDNHCAENKLCRAHRCWDPCSRVCDDTNICKVEHHQIECLCPGTQKKNPYEVSSRCYDVDCFVDDDCQDESVCDGHNTCSVLEIFGETTAPIPIAVPGGVPELPWWFTDIPRISPVNVISVKETKNLTSF